jgi:uncharacterized protein YjiS (DUF1127 family)
MSDDGFDPSACDPRHLTPQQGTALRKCIVSRAQEERNRLIRQMVVGGFRALWRAWRRMLLRQEARAALRSMTDRELWDIGISRSGIEGAIRRDDTDAVDEPVSRRYGVVAPTGRSRGGCEPPEQCRARLHQG